MELKWTITLGELIQVGTLVVGVFTIYHKLSIKIEKLETKVEPVYKWWESVIGFGGSSSWDRYKHPGRHQ